MFIPVLLTNEFLYEKSKGNIDMDGDTFKAILMNNSFKFDPSIHGKLSYVTSHQLLTENGYTQNDKTLAGVSITRYNGTNRIYVKWSDVTWTASGGAIISASAIIYDDTHPDDIVVGGFYFGEVLIAPDTEFVKLRDIVLSIGRVPDRDTFTTTTTTTSSTTTTTTAP